MRYLLYMTVMLVSITHMLGQGLQKNAYIMGDSVYIVTSSTNKCECKDKHRVFKTPYKTKPKVIPQLGSNPQFGTLVHVRGSEQVYQHLRNAYMRDERGNARELDSLWRAMGYKGFLDKRFTPAQITLYQYEPGVTGMLGAGGHSYEYSKISPNSDVPLKGYRMSALDNNCDVTIMEICGNAFYPACEEDSKEVACLLPAMARQGTPFLHTFIRNDTCIVQACRNYPEKYKNNHPVYDIPTEGMPKVIDQLGSNPQFGTLIGLETSKNVFLHLQRVYRDNKGNEAAELDRLWRAMGYDGFEDDRFSPDAIVKEILSGGFIGNLGGGGDKYEYSVVEPNSWRVVTYRVKAIDNCDIRIMETCGNAFFGGCPVSDCIEYPIMCTNY